MLLVNVWICLMIMISQQEPSLRHHSCCHSDSIVQLNVAQARKKCEMKLVTMTPSSGMSSPNFHNRLHLGYSSWKLAKNRVLRKVCVKNCQSCFSKTCVNFAHCYGNQRWAEAVENNFLFWTLRLEYGLLTKIAFWSLLKVQSETDLWVKTVRKNSIAKLV